MEAFKKVGDAIKQAQGGNHQDTSNNNNNNNNGFDNRRDDSDRKENRGNEPVEQSGKKSGGLFGNFGNKFNEMAGGGKKAEEQEDMLDKGIDAFQEHILKQGPQNNESAAEQFKDKMIADQIRSQYKNVSGKDFPSNKPRQT